MLAFMFSMWVGSSSPVFVVSTGSGTHRADYPSTVSGWLFGEVFDGVDGGLEAFVEDAEGGEELVSGFLVEG